MGKRAVGRHKRTEIERITETREIEVVRQVGESKRKERRMITKERGTERGQREREWGGAIWSER